MKGLKTKMFGKNVLVALIIILAISSTAIMVHAQSATDSATGTVTVGNAAPTVASVEAVDASYSLVTAFTPDNTAIFGINATVTDSNTLSDLSYVTFYLYDNSIHSGDYNVASPNGYDLITLNWTESTDSWVLNQGSFTEWTEQSSVDPGTASGGSSFEFTARFDISRAAYADTDWRFSVTAVDDQAASNTASVGSDHEMEVYFEISWSASTFAWGSVSTSSSNNIMLANRTLTIRANTQWELQLNGSDFTAGGEADEDLQTQDMVTWDEDGVVGGNSFFLRNALTTGLGTWDNQARMTATETPFSRDIHLWFQETGDLTPDVEYSITVWVVLQANV